MLLQSPPFWWVDDNAGFANKIYSKTMANSISIKYRQAPPRCVPYLNMLLECKEHTLGLTLPLYFIDVAKYLHTNGMSDKQVSK